MSKEKFLREREFLTNRKHWGWVQEGNSMEITSLGDGCTRIVGHIYRSGLMIHGNKWRTIFIFIDLDISRIFYRFFLASEKGEFFRTF